MRSNPQRVAWTVLSVAFVVFCILITGVPLGIRSYLLNTGQEQDTRLQRIAGTIQLQKTEGGQPNAVTETASVVPGDEIILDATSRGTLDLFERSHVTLYSNTTVQLTRVEAPRFKVSDGANNITLRLTGGLVRVGVALPSERETEFQVLTPHLFSETIVFSKASGLMNRFSWDEIYSMKLINFGIFSQLNFATRKGLLRKMQLAQIKVI